MKQIFRNEKCAVYENNGACGVVLLKTMRFVTNLKTGNLLFTRVEALEYAKKEEEKENV